MGQEKHIRPIKAWAQKWHTHLILLDITSQMAEPKINGEGKGLILSLCQEQFKGHGYREVERTGTGNISPKKQVCWFLGQCLWAGELEASHQDSRGNKVFEMLSLLCDKFAKLFYIYCTIGALSHSVRFT